VEQAILLQKQDGFSKKRMKKLTKFIVGVGLLFALAACSDSSENEIKEDLELLFSYGVNVAEPSGLVINDTGTILYTVSDNTNKIYKISTTGNVLQTFSYVGNDLEGVSTYTKNKLLVAEERTKEIVSFDMTTSEVVKHKISYDNSDANSGIEGVAYNSDDGTIFMINEKDPGLLLRLRSNFSILSEYNLDFASDYSGIFYDKKGKNLWITSDQNKTINKCDLTGKLLKSYSINVTKAEGIAVTNTEIYVISDATAQLYIFKKPIN
jgi:uncharacterized protein YjiK